MLIELLITFLVILVIVYIILHCHQDAQILQLIVLLISGFIQLFAGWMLFGYNENGVIEKIHGLLALIPTLMDLKGNLEMSMASRLSTIANTTENMKTMARTGNVILKNVILIQCQVTIMTLFAIIVTTCFVCIKDVHVSWDKILILCAIGLITSMVTCTILGKLKFCQ